MATQAKTQVLETLETKTIKTQNDLVKKLGRPLGSPIHGKTVGSTFEVELTGKIELREFEKVKAAYFLTKEGISIKVNASFDPAVHVAGKVMTAVCREMEVIRDNKPTMIKFAMFADN